MNINNITEYPDKDIAIYLAEYHKGIDNAISNKRLADRFNLDERTLRRLITRLILVYKIPIGSTSGKYSGIFYISNESERNYACGELASRREELKKREEAIMEGFDNEHRDEQLVLSGVEK